MPSSFPLPFEAGRTRPRTAGLAATGPGGFVRLFSFRWMARRIPSFERDDRRPLRRAIPEGDGRAAGRLRREGRQRKGLRLEEARHILWMYTSRDVYRMLVQESGWTPARYEEWLSEAILQALVGVSHRA